MSIEEINLYMLIVIIIQTIAILITLVYLYFSTKNEMRNMKQSTERQVDTIRESTREQIDITNKSTQAQIESINRSTQENLKGFQSMITQLEKTNENLIESVNKLSIIASRIEEEEKNKPKLHCDCPQFKEEILLRKGAENIMEIRLANSGNLFAEKVSLSLIVPKKLNPTEWRWGNTKIREFPEGGIEHPDTYFLHLIFNEDLEGGLTFPTKLNFNPTDIGDYKIWYTAQCVGHPPFKGEIPVKVVA